jgi:hypothetical protein
VAGHWPRCDLALGCAGHYRASTRPAAGAHTAQPSGGQKCGTRRRGGAHVPCIKRHGTTAGAQDQRSATASTSTWGCPGATNHRGGFTRGSANWRPGLECASRCVATAVLAHARPCHACSAQPSGTQRRITEWLGGTPNVFCKTTSARRSVHSHRPRTAMAGTRA